MPIPLTRDEMIELVGRIYSAQGSEDDASEDIALFVENCRHPSKADILFWPELVPELRGRVPTAEEVVDLAMSGEG